MSGLLDKLLHKERAVAKRRQGLGVRPLVVLLQLLKDTTEDAASLISAATPEGAR